MKYLFFIVLLWGSSTKKGIEFEFLQTKKDSSLYYKKQGLIYYKEKRWEKAITSYRKVLVNDSLPIKGETYFDLGLCFRNIDNQDSLLVNTNKAYLIYKQLPLSENQAFLFLKCGIIFKNSGNYISAIESLNQAYSCFGELNDIKNKAYTCKVLGEVHRLSQNLEVAKKYYNEYLSIQLKRQDSIKISHGYNSLGNFYYELDKYDSASFYYLKAVKIQKKIPKTKNLGRMLNNLGATYYNQKKFDLANETFLYALKTKKREGDTLSLTYSFNELASIALEMKEYTQAKKYLEKSKISIHTVTNKDVILRYYELYAKYYTIKGAYQKATRYYEKYIKLYKGLYNDENSKRELLLYDKFENRQKDSHIGELTTSNQEKEKSINKLGFIISAISILLIISFLILIFKRKADEIKRLKDVFKGQEEIKQLVSMDLHDIIVPQLSKLQLKYSLPFASKDSNTVTNIIKSVKDIQQQLRFTAHRLSPLRGKIKNLPFHEIITLELSEFQYHHNIVMEIQIPFPEVFESLSIDAQTYLYGYILEVLHNIEKHAQASFIKIDHKVIKGQIYLFIQDNGIGISKKNKVGIGMLNIQQRAKLLHGTVSFEKNNKGTLFTLVFTIKNNLL